MFDKIRKALGMGNTVNFKELVQQGAIIVDVRTKEEYAGGHIKSSLNIPLSNLNNHLVSLKKQDKTVITCCASGMRSANAKNILSAHGINTHNAGSWKSLQSKIHS